jgi:hypothetical protein
LEAQVQGVAQPAEDGRQLVQTIAPRTCLTLATTSTKEWMHGGRLLAIGPNCLDCMAREREHLRKATCGTIDEPRSRLPRPCERRRRNTT